MSYRRCLLGESPLWHEVEQVFYWVDILRHRVFRYDAVSGRVQVVHEGRMVTALSEDEGGGLVLVTPEAILSYRHGVTSPMASLDFDDRVRTNDGKTDPGGRLWFGTMDYRLRDPIGVLCVYDGMSVRTVEEGIVLSNGIGWSPDRDVMYHIDTIRRQIYVYRYDDESGEVGDRRVLADLSDRRGFPDGLAVDVDGNLWVAFYDGWCLRVIDPSGHVVDEVRLGVQKPTSVAFAGPDRDQLYVTTAAQDLNQDELLEQPEAGRLLRFAPGTTGLAPGVFSA